MKAITTQSTNVIDINGKLMDATVVDGTLKDGRAYKRANLTVRVTQTFGGREETSEIPVSMFASQFTQANKPNPSYEHLKQLEVMPTVQNAGNEGAATIHFSRANLRENNFVSKSGQAINGWQINASFINAPKAAEYATFNIDIFIMDMHDEMDREGEPTGRLIVKGGIVQYGGKLDVVEFVVESPDSVNYVSRNWNINDTVNAQGYIRFTSREESSSQTGSWGESIPTTTTRLARELVITYGSDEGFAEEIAYDPADIKKAFNVRKAAIEQMLVDATSAQKSAASAVKPETSKYSWE